MRCDVCGYRPRGMELFGGSYWRRLLGDVLCPCCEYWAHRLGAL